VEMRKTEKEYLRPLQLLTEEITIMILQKVKLYKYYITVCFNMQYFYIIF